MRCPLFFCYNGVVDSQSCPLPVNEVHASRGIWTLRLRLCRRLSRRECGHSPLVKDNATESRGHHTLRGCRAGPLGRRARQHYGRDVGHSAVLHETRPLRHGNLRLVACSFTTIAPDNAEVSEVSLSLGRRRGDS